MTIDDAAATELARRRREKVRGPRLDAAIRPISISEGFAVQQRVASRMGTVAGWKCSLPTAERTTAAPLFTGTLHRGDHATVLARGSTALIEPEVAFVLGRDLRPRSAAYTDADVVAAIGEARLVLEILGNRYDDPANVPFPEMLADCVNNEGLIIGPVLPDALQKPLETMDIAIMGVGGFHLERAGRHPDGHPLRPLVWLANFQRERGERLTAGQVITTGSYAGALEVPTRDAAHHHVRHARPHARHARPRALNHVTEGMRMSAEATSTRGLDDTLHPDIEPYASGRFAVSTRHAMHWEMCGNADGVPIVFLHGGPGGGSLPHHRRFYDPAFWRIVLYDQRGAGRSTPLAEITDNTTAHLVSDLDRLRAHLGVDRWVLFGGCWGSTLALAYAEAHPQRVLGLVLRGIFLATPGEIEWFLYGMRYIFPEAWRDFTEYLPEDERDDLLAAYYRRLVDPDPAVHLPAARAWDRYEAACSTLLPKPDVPIRVDDDGAALAIARIEAHYFVNNAFLDDDELIEQLAPHPAPAVHDRAGALRHRVPADHRRRAGARVAGSRVHRGARRRALGARAGHHPRARRRGAADAGPARDVGSLALNAR